MEMNSSRPDQQAGRVDTSIMNRAHVVAIGASRGLSSLLTLARSRLGHITIIDYQPVGRENVSQTLFSLDDVDELKVIAAERLIKQRAPFASVSTYALRAQDVPDLDAILAAADVVKIGIDDPRAMFELADRTQAAGTAAVVHAMTGDGQQHFTAFVRPDGQPLKDILPAAWKGIQSGYEPPAYFPSCALHTETMNAAVALMIAGYLHHRAGSSIELLNNVGAGLVEAGLATGFNGYHAPSGFLAPIYFGQP